MCIFYHFFPGFPYFYVHHVKITIGEYNWISFCFFNFLTFWLCWVLVEALGFFIAVCGLSCPWSVRDLSSQDRGWSCVPCPGKQVLHHWAAREAPLAQFAFKIQSDSEELCMGSPLLSICPTVFSFFSFSLTSFFFLTFSSFFNPFFSVIWKLYPSILAFQVAQW